MGTPRLLTALVSTIVLVQYFVVWHILDDYKEPEGNFSNGNPQLTGKDAMWEKLKLNQQQVLDQHQYCMLWCPAEDYVQTSEWELYRDLSPVQAQKKGSYYSTQDRDFYQSQTQKALNTTCCRVATRESFTVLLDNRKEDNLDNDVTLVTFGNYERIEALYEVRDRWHGPLVVVIYIQDYNDMLYANRGDEKHLTSQQELTGLRKALEHPRWDSNSAVIVYFGKFQKDQKFIKIGYNANYFKFSVYSYFPTKEGKVYSREEAEKLDLALLVDFPINTLRNVAQDFAATRYVFAIDMDFMPDAGMYEFFKTQISKVSQADKTGIVVPHFERRPNCEWKGKAYEYPLDFKNLDIQLKAGLVRPFYTELWWWNKHFKTQFFWTAEDLSQVVGANCSVIPTWQQTFPQGVRISNYPQWFANSRNKSSPDLIEVPMEVSFNSSADLQSWEPYVMLDRVANSTHYLMRYNEVFVNRHRDKSSWIFGLRLTGYQFMVGKEHYLIHRTHPYSPWLEDTAGGLSGNQGPSEFIKTRMFLAGNTYVKTLGGTIA
jgi:hypothetical protein